MKHKCYQNYILNFQNAANEETISLIQAESIAVKQSSAKVLCQNCVPKCILMLY